MQHLFQSLESSARGSIMVKARSRPDCARGDTLYCTAYGADSAAAADYMISFADEGTAKIGFVVIGPFLRWRSDIRPLRARSVVSEGKVCIPFLLALASSKATAVGSHPGIPNPIA